MPPVRSGDVIQILQHPVRDRAEDKRPCPASTLARKQLQAKTEIVPAIVFSTHIFYTSRYGLLKRYVRCKIIHNKTSPHPLAIAGVDAAMHLAADRLQTPVRIGKS